MSGNIQGMLPSSWIWITLGEVIEPTIEQGSPEAEQEFLYIDISSIDNRAKKIVTPKRLPTLQAPSRAKQHLEPHDVLVSMTRPNLNAVAIVPDNLTDAIGSTGFHVLRTKSIDPAWLFYLVQTHDFIYAMTIVVQGALYPAVRPKDVNGYEIPLAPMPEQHRIVAEIEKHFTRLDAAVNALKRIQANLKRYRASVLKAACEGRLVPTEAELAKAEGRDYEPADRLLSRILKERRAKWEADQLAKMKVQGKTPKDGKWKSAYLEPYAPEASQLPTLPEGWAWSSPEALSTFESNAICAGPFGTIFKAKDFRPSGIPIIFLRHVSAGRYLTHKPGFMDKDKWEELFQPYSVFGGELLVTKLGEPPGVCAIYPYDIGPAMVTPDVIKMSVNEHASESRFLMHYFNSEDARRFAFGVAFGTTRLRMTLTIFREIPIPMPPLVEQQRIVAEVERHLSIIEELETVVEANLRRAERLRQSILKSAFEGKLVPQDPTDEPASNLLERISTERGKKLSKEKVQKNKRRAGKSGQPKLDWQTPEENIASTKAQTNS